ncbi:hypothetical protein BTO04_10400 [Polaribacter sp. SA4-10]|uniref:hypothetical protein n=1 Tax=Polaribacter sp. SA4-10 TaxID=754397 RepID=UPI000B3CA7AE|nr:hypothetical protein [Polaribacter sp. SA4-10]ARV07073.1 hypothetical protein BTO04_10400 [Polaribacter sp. SA4-10]
MKVIINDANILIDLVKLELLEVFSELKFELHTTDFVFEEIYDEQKEAISILTSSNKLNIIETASIDDFSGINNILEKSNGVSFEDCSVWYYSKKLSGVLLTGDAQLRKQAKKDDLEVRGILYIFDELLNQNLITHEIALQKIKELYLFNNRLPKREVEQRIELWKNS